MIILLIFIFLFPQNKCWRDRHHHNTNGKLEIIDMGGVSTFNEYQINKDDFKFNLIDTKFPKERRSRFTYKDFSLTLKLYSNDDTGNDRITIYFGEAVIYQSLFGEYKEVAIVNHSIYFNQLRFVIDNEHTPNNTAGAFSATIKIKDITRGRYRETGKPKPNINE